METKWLIYVLIMFVFSSLIMGVCEEVYLYEGPDTIAEGQETSILTRLTTFDTSEIAIPFVGEIYAAVKWLGALLSAMFFNYSIFEGSFVLVKYLLWMISAAIVGRLLLAWRGA